MIVTMTMTMENLHSMQISSSGTGTRNERITLQIVTPRMELMLLRAIHHGQQLTIEGLHPLYIKWDE